MAKTVFLFGAGASFATGAPLMPSFLDSAFALRSSLSAGVTKDAFDLVYDLIQNRLPQLHSKSVVDLDNIESVFGLVEMGRLIGRLPGTEPSEVESVSQALRRVLAETIESMCQFNLDSEGHITPHDSYYRLVHQLRTIQTNAPRPHWAFISFNYDVALDFAIHWSNLVADYGVASLPTTAPSVPLLKLHGSLNWTTCPKCGAIMTLPWDRLFSQSPRVRSSQGPRKSTLATSQRLTMLSGHCEGAPANPEPAIVPPSWNKTQYHRSFGPVWRRAASELADAEEIYVIGYSLPDTDSFFRDLVALGIVGSTRIRHFTVVNPDTSVAKKFRDLLGPSVGSRFKEDHRKFEVFANEEYPGRISP